MKSDAASKSDRGAAVSPGVTIRSKLTGVVIALGGAVLAVTLLTLFSSAEQRSQMSRARERMEQLESVLLPLQYATRELQVDVIQVQQFLSDASATHHDDSFDDAKKYAADFATQAARLQDLLGRLPPALGGAAIQSKLDGMQRRFAEFDASGVTMAHTYIDKGVEAGNVEMEAFDKMSDGLFGELDGFLKIINGIVSASSQDTLSAVDSSDATASAMNRNISIVTAFGLVLVVASAWFVRRQVSKPLAELELSTRRVVEGRVDFDISGCSRRDEIGAMARALKDFRDSRSEVARMEGEVARERASAQDAREQEERFKEATRRQLEEAITRLAGGLRSVAAGDLSVRLDNSLAPQFAAIRDDFNGAMAELSQLLGSVVATIHTIESGSREIWTASQDLSLRAERQAGSLEESNAAIRELTGVVARTADASNRTKDVVVAARQETAENDHLLHETVQAIERIKGSSEKIGAIIGVIDEIAFQTNLLALNAGVEAARAGDSGRGFAVVAQEVRALAQRSADAAKQIKHLISQSTEEVGKGVALVSATGAAFERIKLEIGSIDGGIAEIAVQAIDQSSTLKQVNVAITEIDQMTQVNASMAEEATAASQSLANECAQLLRMVSKFRLGEAQNGPRAVARSSDATIRSVARGA